MTSKETGFVPELGVVNVRLASSFYQRTFGFSEVELVTDDSGEPIWVELALDDARLMCQRLDILAGEISGISGEPVAPTAVHVLRVKPQKRALELFSKAQDAGAANSAITITDYGTAEFSVVDPDGHLVLVAGRD